MFKKLSLVVMLVISPLLFGQQHKIKGMVTDETKFAVAGVIVRLQQQPNITAYTNEQGAYSLSFTPEGKEVILEIYGHYIDENYSKKRLH